MTCNQVHHLMVLYVANDPSLTAEKRKAFEAHLYNCQECARKYKESRRIIGLVKESWPYEEENQDFLKRIKQPNQRHEVIDKCWEDLKCRIPELTHFEKPREYLWLFQCIRAAAACLVIGVFVFLVFSIYSKPKSAPMHAPQQVSLAPKPSVRIELVSKNGSILIPAGQQMPATDELKTLIINGKHRLMMNINTLLTVEPHIENNQIGCLVKLASGEIYTHVERDGSPFLVDTAYGKAVITGTTFDIKATDISTTLVVTEGVVRFESEKGIVKVAAGQMSKITGESVPSIPLSCNSTELTAWATGSKAEPALAKTDLNFDPWDLPLSFGEKIVLDKTDYISWVNERRGWFKKDFPWIFELKNALAGEGIEVDYPDLLLKSDDVWQFVCLQKFPARFSVPDFESLLKAASSYGFDKEWLLRNVPTAKTVQNKSLLLQNPAGLAAFEQLLKYANEIEAAPYYLYPADACKYLAETRSLIWFAVRDGKYNLTDEERTEVLALLQKEVAAACNCQNDELYPSGEQEKPSCDNRCQESVDPIVGHIKKIKAIEESIAGYEIAK